MLIGCKVNNLGEDFKFFVLDAVFDKFCKAELAAEVYETGKRTEFSGNNAVGLVNKKILNELLAEADRNGHSGGRSWEE